MSLPPEVAELFNSDDDIADPDLLPENEEEMGTYNLQEEEDSDLEVSGYSHTISQYETVMKIRLSVIYGMNP